MFSRALKGTSKKKTTMNWWEYLIGHCWMTGWQSIGMSFRNWRDLMTDNYANYKLMWYDDPYEECYSCFWTYLGDDDVLPKDFLEHLMQMVGWELIMASMVFLKRTSLIRQASFALSILAL